MKTLRFALVLCAVLATSARTRHVSAQASPVGSPSAAAKSEASTHFRRGAQLFQDGLFRAALVELKRAYEIAPNFRVLYNIGQTHEALGEFVQAVHAYESYLEQGGAAVPAARRAELEAAVPQLRSHTGTLRIRANRDGAAVSVDDQEVGIAPLPSAILVNVGQHRISARTEDGWSAIAEVDIAGGDHDEVVLQLAAPRGAELPSVAGSPVPVLDPKLSKRRKWAIGLMSSGGALAIAGGALALLTRSAQDDYERELDTRPGDPRAIEDARDQLRRLSISADVMLGAALLSGAGGLVLYFRKSERRDAAPGRNKVEARVRLAPTALVAEGHF